MLFKLFAPKSECFTKYNAFCSYIFDYECFGRKVYCYQNGSKLWKNCINQKPVRKWLVGGCIPHISPGTAPARTDNNVSNHYANQPIRLKYDVMQILSQLF